MINGTTTKTLCEDHRYLYANHLLRQSDELLLCGMDIDLGKLVTQLRVIILAILSH